MKTVPTLCATSTVVGASVVGLSFGREASADRLNKRKAAPARDLHHSHTAMSATTTAVSAAAPAAAISKAKTSSAPSMPSALPVASHSRVPVATRLGQHGRMQRRISRRMTSDDQSLVSRGTNGSMINGCGSSISPQPHHALIRPDADDSIFVTPKGPPWINRLSYSDSQTSSRNSSPGPLAPSVSVAMSRGSMAFSHDGSNASMLGRREPSPLPPNKLVKRSSSVRAPRPASVREYGSRLPTLRRPATSHQRSATLQHHPIQVTEHASGPLIEEEQQQQQLPTGLGDAEYMRYFTAKKTSGRSLTKRKNSANNTKSMTRISPDEKHLPTLLLAKSISAGTSEVQQDSASEDDESVFALSRPGSPECIPAAVTGSANEQEDVQPRRSFSITNFLSSGSGVKKPRFANLSGSYIPRVAGQRISSAPLPAMGRRASSTADGSPAAASARRDLTELALLQRNISTSAGPSTRPTNLRHGHLDASFSSSPLPTSPKHHALAMGDELVLPRPRQSDGSASASLTTNHIPPSPTLVQASARPSRHSVAPSEQASTLVGSDNETRGLGSGDEEDGDIQSETLFDSLRTGATKSTMGARGPRIETIFDESPPSKVKISNLRDLLPRGAFRDQATDGLPGHQSIAEEEESISTPVRTVVPDRSIHDSPSLPRGHGAALFSSLIPSSPPDMPKPLSLGTLEWDSQVADENNSNRWSVGEAEKDDPWGDFPSHQPAIGTPEVLARHNLRALATGSSPKPATPQHLVADHADRDTRSSIFDWSEQQFADKSSGNRTPPRPRTVHGKKDADGRGSRAVGRRAPSGLHARSQSVPVAPDATGKRTTVVTNKFGTWGVGSKGVTEDWDDDFDFADSAAESAATGGNDAQKADGGSSMVVPQTIREQQSNVLANIGLLREWGLLIEELKEQRIRAANLDILQGSTAGMWEEVDAMIDLADQEAVSDEVPRLSPPSSPGFDETAFDDASRPSPSQSRAWRKSGFTNDDFNIPLNHVHQVPLPGRPRRKSILPPNYDIFAPQSSPIPSKSRYGTPDSNPITTRPRKDSEAKARSVIEALQRRRTAYEPGTNLPATPSSKKVPFDTATLRRIVPYVNTLTRQVKDALREAEGLYYSPNASPDLNENTPPFSKIFLTDNDLATQMKLMTVM